MSISQNIQIVIQTQQFTYDIIVVERGKIKEIANKLNQIKSSQNIVHFDENGLK